MSVILPPCARGAGDAFILLATDRSCVPRLLNDTLPNDKRAASALFVHNKSISVHYRSPRGESDVVKCVLRVRWLGEEGRGIGIEDFAWNSERPGKGEKKKKKL